MSTEEEEEECVKGMPDNEGFVEAHVFKDEL